MKRGERSLLSVLAHVLSGRFCVLRVIDIKAVSTRAAASDLLYPRLSLARIAQTGADIRMC